MDKQERKEKMELIKKAQGSTWEPLSIPAAKTYKLATKPDRSERKRETRRMIDDMER